MRFSHALLGVLFFGLAYSCQAYNSTNLINQSFERSVFFGGQDCVNISDLDAVIYLVHANNSVVLLNFSQNATSSDNVTYAAPDLPKLNLNITRNSGQGYYNETFNISFSCNLSSGSSRALSFGESATCSDGNVISAPNFPAINRQVDLSSGVWWPEDARYNLTVRSIANASPTCNLPESVTLGWGQHIDFCGRSFGCQTPPITENKTITPDTPLNLSGIQISCLKADLNWTSLPPNETKENQEYGIFVSTAPYDATNFSFYRMQNISCNLTKRLDEGVDVCLDDVFSLCGDNKEAVLALQAGNVAPCLDVRFQTTKASREQYERMWNETQAPTGPNSIVECRKDLDGEKKQNSRIDTILQNFGLMFGGFFLGAYLLVRHFSKSKTYPRIGIGQKPEMKPPKQPDDEDWGV